MKTTLFGKIFLILPLLLIIAPFVLVFGFGLWYLYEKGWFVYWLLTVVAILFLAKINFWIFHNKEYPIFKNKPEVAPNDKWGSQDDEVFANLKAFAKTIDKSTIAFDKNLPNRLLDMGIETTQKVAAFYYPQSPNPALEVSLPHLLRISELVLKDIRKELVEKVPFSHRITINHFLKVPKMVDFFSDANASYRVGRMVVNPIGSILSEIKEHITNKLFTYSKDELLQWIVNFYILEVARYSIDLYGHNITLNEFQPTHDTTPNKFEESIKEQPLKIVLVGQTNSGKSSLINALFGTPRAFVDEAPTQTGIRYYEYSTDNHLDTILVDTQGYQSIHERDSSYLAIISEIKSSDIILLLLSATNAARQSDKALLEGIKTYYTANLKLRQPVILGVVNQLDKLSPQKEWQPPFNIQSPKTPKEQNIQQALEVIQKELGLEKLIPINLHPNRPYNIKEALIPTILENLDEAKKVQYIRSLREYQDKEFWIKLKEQAKATGRFMMGRK
ncbi:MAG: 50S ribosome-binding GTPase [Campylobacterales bacterium]|nr:50S ribosome-binding GTPase [Campylobacterales bacterium]